uniref:uncharacterized protein LOC122580645 n=1 Tax=Erigeron canadensis TaxID=72917 RepID=UPI001CB9C33E|nr:uncharacterized protein LOC122580645 [Erigeron canadensis]
MAMLANCWLIIECYLIPDGYMKWFFLSFYINPCFLFFCQIYLWIKAIQKWIFLFIFLLGRYLFLPLLAFLRRFLIKTHPSSGVSDGNTEVEDEDVWFEETDSYSSSSTSSRILFLHYEESYKIPNIAFSNVLESVDQETIYVHSSSDLDEEITCSSGCSSPTSSYSFGSRRGMEVTPSTTPSSSYTLPDTLLEYPEVANVDEAQKGLTDFLTPLLVVKPDEEEKDSFYKLYNERMSWFDLLSQERSCGLNALLAKTEHSASEKRIIRSLESDIEMVYVAQSCLSWEALHDQYRKLEGIIDSCNDVTNCASPYGALCSGAFVNKLQRFQILLERFMEDEIFEKGKRYWNFVRKRASYKSLLQVPDVSESGGNDTKGRIGGMMIRATDVLKTIEKCIKTFKSFIEIDEKKPWWRAHNRHSWSRSPLEDPQDYNLLHNLKHTLRQKELWMKDLKGKQRCWMKRSMKVMEDGDHNKEMMFVVIELKLVARLLMMPVISSSQLQWCKQKLDNIKISHGRITRQCSHSLLFPPS